MATVKRAVTRVDVVSQSLGVSAGPEVILKPTRFFSKATRVLVTAMEEAQVKRLICVTGFGADTDCTAAEGERPRPAHEWGSLVPSHAVSMVSIDPPGHHDHPPGDPCALASERLPSVLALEIPPSWRSTASWRGSARADPADEH